MRKDPTEFRERFAKWKAGEKVYEAGLPKYGGGKGNIDFYDDVTKHIILKEGFLAAPKDIGDGKITIGSGLTHPKYINLYKRNGNRWSEKENYAAVKDTIREFEAPIRNILPEYDRYPAEMRKAILDIMFNIGEGGLRKSTKFLTAMRSHNWNEAKRLMDWDNSDPLFGNGARKRNAERAALFDAGLAHWSPTGPVELMMENKPVFVPQPVIIKQPVQTDYSILTMTDPTIPVVINSRSSGDSPLYGGNDYSFRMPSIKEVMERLLFLKSSGFLPKFKDGKGVYLTDKSTNAKFNDDGTFTDDYTRVFDDLVITNKGPRVKSGQLYKYLEPWTDSGFMSAVTMGLNPLLSPVHTGRALYNIFTDTGYHDVAKDIFMPNSGLFTNNFYNNHPIISTVGNIVGDAVAGNVFNKSINPVLLLIDRGGTPVSRILNQTDDTMTRLIGTGDSGYKDLLTSGIIRGNKKPTREGTTGQLHNIAEKLYKILPEDDVRDYLSNNFRNELQYNRVRDAVKSLDEVKGNRVGGIQLAKKKHWDYPETYGEYIKMTTSPEALEKQNNLMFSRLWSNKNKNPWVKNWLPNKNVAVILYDWPNLPTFALSNEKMTNRLFVGDFGVLIKNAHKHAQEAFDFGHFREHPVTKYPMSYLHPDVSVYRRSDGILTGTKYMKKIPKWKLKYDAYKYKTNPNYTLDVSKNHTPMFPNGLPNIQIPYFVGLNRIFDNNTYAE